MSPLRPASEAQTSVAVPQSRIGAWPTLLATRADRFVTAAAERPYRSTAAFLALNLSLALLFIGLGELIFADPAEFFREFMPGTWLSCAELLLMAAAAWAIYRAVTGGDRLHLNNFWALSVVVFCVFAVDEITQATIFIADALTAAGALAPAGFRDLDAFLLVVLFGGAAVVMLRYAGDLLRHPAAIAVLAVGVALGTASQTLDSLLPATQSEFVAEETLKLAAEAFLIGGYLVVLHKVASLRPDRRA